MYVVLSLLMFLSTTLFVLLFVCLMVLVNCLLNAFAICLCVVAVLLLKKMVLLCVWAVFLFPRPCIVLYSACVFCLWSHLLFRCSFHMFVLCSCMREMISRIRPFSVGSDGLLSLHVLCIVPFGMWSLSACRIMLLKNVVCCVGLWVLWWVRKLFLCLCCCSVYLVFVFSVVNMGRWSELSGVSFVYQVVLL